MSSRIGTTVSSPWWGAPATVRWRVRGGPASDLAGGALLLAAWILLWAFFVIAVVGPAARLHRAPEMVPAGEEVELQATTGATSRG